MNKHVFSVAALALLAMSLNVSTPAQAEELNFDSIVIAQADEVDEVEDSIAVPVDEGEEMPLPDDGGGEDGGDDADGEDTGSDE